MNQVKTRINHEDILAQSIESNSLAWRLARQWFSCQHVAIWPTFVIYLHISRGLALTGNFRSPKLFNQKQLLRITQQDERGKTDLTFPLDILLVRVQLFLIYYLWKSSKTLYVVAGFLGSLKLGLKTKNKTGINGCSQSNQWPSTVRDMWNTPRSWPKYSEWQNLSTPDVLVISLYTYMYR